MKTSAPATVNEQTWRSKLQTKVIDMILTFIKSRRRTTRATLIRALGKTIFRCAKKTRNRAIKNIANALPELSIAQVSALAEKAYANCAFGVMESFWLEQLEPEIFCDEATLRILQSGQGACIATMHLGCYDAVPVAVQKLANQSVTLTDIPSFIEQGESHYQKGNIIAIDKNSSSAFSELLKSARNNAYISLHSDLWANEVSVDFFGQTTKAPAGVALLSAISKKPLLLGYAVYQEDTRIKVFFETIYQFDAPHPNNREAKTPEQLMQIIHQRFEDIIKQYPEQWYWSYKRWR
ncbi:lysophospholipid acyltransferase family protein [Litorilituus sediminis]|uniref:Lipid A biosynthesis acyltransferase n=1 Tax=Litorilituus sediminis TaxID=718192 RepID=A0A4P6P815_9GAMM|nr:lipid A biosynthesis acyltransferase [Litorilituus sediminis]QBG36399.1 lipid A biosynthesis acyltransferase [Litorilituus sediminis]